MSTLHIVVRPRSLFESPVLRMLTREDPRLHPMSSWVIDWIEVINFLDMGVNVAVAMSQTKLEKLSHEAIFQELKAAHQVEVHREQLQS